MLSLGFKVIWLQDFEDFTESFKIQENLRISSVKANDNPIGSVGLREGLRERETKFAPCFEKAG